MVGAWACANGIVLGQRKTEEKSNEITAIPELLKVLEIQGCIQTPDEVYFGFHHPVKMQPDVFYYKST
jgi:predicted transposase YbfD/YdcC